MLFSLQELCKKLHEQIDVSEEERYSIEFKLNLVLNEVRHSSLDLFTVLILPSVCEVITKCSVDKYLIILMILSLVFHDS